MLNYKVIINNKEYNVCYENKKIKTKRLRINANGQIIVSGYNMNTNEINIIVSKYSDWIDKTLVKLESKKEDVSFLEIKNFECLWILGKKYKIISGDKFTIKDDLIICDSNKTKKETFYKVRDSFLYILKERMDYYSKVFNIYPLFEFKEMKSKFGYCLYLKNKIVLSKRLIHYSLKEIDYVIVHEFCHFFVPNHSKDFYLKVAEVIPDFKRTVKDLKKSSYLCKY